MPGGLMNGKVVIVTGAGRGIGAAIASDLARNGANVVVADLNATAAEGVAAAIAQTGGKALASGSTSPTAQAPDRPLKRRSPISGGWT